MILAPQLLQYIIVQYASRPLGSQYITVQTVKSGSGVGGRVGGNVRGQGSGVSGGSTVRVDGRVFHDGLSTENLKQSQNAPIHKTGGLSI